MKSEQKTTAIDKKDLDLNEVKSSVEKSGEFISGNITLKKWEEEEGKKGQKLYILKNEENPFFLGIVNSLFERYGCCVNNYENGDKYFGYYKDDHRNGHGFYAFNPIKEKNLLFSEFYFGLWKNDLKNGRGVYLWLNEKEDKKPFSDFDSANFQSFIGEIKKGKPTKGIILSKIGEDYLVYHGSFDDDFKRSGEKCFYYSSTLEELCFGSFKNNEFGSCVITSIGSLGIADSYAPIPPLTFAPLLLTLCSRYDVNIKDENGKIVTKSYVKMNFTSDCRFFDTYSAAAIMKDIHLIGEDPELFEKECKKYESEEN